MTIRLPHFTRLALLTVSVGLATGACAAPTDDADPEVAGDTEQDVTKTVSTKALVKGNNAFATDLYGALSAGNENVFFSPYSVSSALAITYAGARSQTSAAMRGTLRLPAGNVHAAFRALDADLAKRNAPETGRGEGFKLSIANSLWGEKTQHFQAPFMKVLKDNYGAGLELADFHKAPDAERVRINGWVENATNDKIKDLLPLGVIQSDTRLVLVDAIYFKASWNHAFAAANTKRATFTALDGSKNDVDMMAEDRDMSAATTATYDAVAIPYLGNQVEFVAIAPKAGTFKTFEKNLDATSIDRIYSTLEPRQVALRVPRFKIDGASTKLKDTLSTMGMGVAFTDAADLSGITGKPDTKISDVVHKAFIKLDEKGTEAAAATAVIVIGKTVHMPLPLAHVDLDRPFIFAIRDVSTGSILFLGRISKPE